MYSTFDNLQINSVHLGIFGFVPIKPNSTAPIEQIQEHKFY